MTTYNTGNPLGSADPKDLFDNAQNLDEVVNGTDLNWTDRLGVQRRTLAGAFDDFPNTAANRAAAEAAELGAQTAQGLAEDARDAAQAAQSAAEQSEISAGISASSASLSASAALAASNTYADTAAGLAGTVDGDVFLVVTADPQIFEVYDNQVGVAVLLGELNIADGRLIEETTLADYAYTIQDSLGKIAFGVKDDGTVVIGEAEISKLTKAGSFARYPGAFINEIVYISSNGQSNGAGATASDLTTTQEYDNVGFPARVTSPTAFLPLTVANTRNGVNFESPMYGGLGFCKELITNENGIDFTINDYLMAVGNNSVSGQSIANMSLGTSAFTSTIGQVQAAFTIATNMGKSMGFPAVFWTQGEADTGTANYGDLLRQLIDDYNTEGIAITGQTQPVHLISWQCTSPQGQNAGEQTLQVANDYDLVHVAAPAYIFDYLDTTHIDAVSSKWLGGYYGLVYKRVIIDGKKWEPLQPVAHAVLGSTIDLIFNKTGLVFDTTTVPAQTNQGFSLTGAGGATITNVEIVQPNRVRLTCSAPVASGWNVRYGYGVTAVGKGPYLGAAGNLRDSQGDSLVYQEISKRMDNWCVLFNYEV